ncbi:MAG: hypothetical protein FWC69_03815 [Defluviitaleaceae bacterium]|nr:hypothetical protein [Defluviitaleaceae bacterium]
MIKAKELREMRPQVRYQDGLHITLEVVYASLYEEAHNQGIPAAFYYDKISHNLLGTDVEDCLVLYHPDHLKDYYKVAIRIKHQGNYAFVTVNDFGKSTSMGNEGSKEYLKETFRQKGNTAEKVGAAIGSGLRRLVKGGSNRQKLEEETNWYTMVTDIFDRIIA